LEPDLISLDSLKTAHQIYSNIIHDPSFQISLEEAKEFLKTYQKVLSELEVI
jgi:hypothetical protein